MRVPGPGGEERRAADDLLRVLIERIDRMEDRAGARFDDLAKEITLSRHGGREALAMVTQQLVENVRIVALHAQTLEGHGRAIDELERRTSEDGPIDRRFRRHDERIAAVATTQATSGKFSWGDVWRVAAGVSAIIAIVGGVLAIARVLAATGTA